MQALAEHAPWIESVGLFIAGLWSTLIGWLWRRQTHRLDDHGRRIGNLEREKADGKRVDRLEVWLRDDVRSLHEKLDDIKDQLVEEKRK